MIVLLLKFPGVGAGSMSEAKKYYVRVWGSFEIDSWDGKSYLPPGTKSRAVVATLCTAPGYRRSRRWLEAIFWGDCPPQQAAANLRQVLLRLKRSPICIEGILCIDVHSIWLNGKLVEVLPRRRSTETFLEGLDVGEEGFEDWLLEERQAGAQAVLASPTMLMPRLEASQAARPRIYILRDPKVAAADAEIAQLATCVRNTLFELELFDIREGVLPPDVGLTIVPERISRDRVGLKVADSSNGSILWSEDCREDAAFAASRLSDQCAEALLDIFAESSRLPNFENDVAEARAIKVIMDGLFLPGSRAPQEIENSVTLSFQISKTGINYGLRNCVRMLKYGERISGFDAIQREVVIEDLRRSVAESPRSAFAHALAAHTCSLFLREPDAAIEHGSLAVSLGPTSSLVSSLYALTLLRSGVIDDAENWANRANCLSRGSRYRPFNVGVMACVAAAKGDFHASLRLARATKLLLPKFRAVNKLLFLGYTMTGELDRAHAEAQNILLGEPEFGRRLLAENTPTVGIPVLRRAMHDSAVRLGLP